MLKKKNCLKKKKDFEELFKKGKGFNSEFLFLKIKENNLDCSRFGFIVSQKVSKKAVVRNRIKRRLREIVRKRLPEIKKGIDVAVVVNKNVEREKTKDLEEKIEEFFKKAKII